MNSQYDVFNAIKSERTYQDHKWGTIKNRPHDVGTWLLIMRVLMNKAEYAYASGIGEVETLNELRKIVSVGVACMEQHGIIQRKSNHETRQNT